MYLNNNIKIYTITTPDLFIFWRWRRINKEKIYIQRQPSVFSSHTISWFQQTQQLSVSQSSPPDCRNSSNLETVIHTIALLIILWPSDLSVHLFLPLIQISIKSQSPTLDFAISVSLPTNFFSFLFCAYKIISPVVLYSTTTCDYRHGYQHS